MLTSTLVLAAAAYDTVVVPPHCGTGTPCNTASPVLVPTNLWGHAHAIRESSTIAYILLVGLALVTGWALLWREQTTDIWQ
mmetsp:Transcript_33595/g.55206  ORF Transcript_33595/g.55206 Transcript_33595/m.55206 type:complete len:81 (-) Transcript_33595:123-365(-)